MFFHYEEKNLFAIWWTRGRVPPLGPTTKLRQLFPSLIAPLPQLQLGEWHLNIAAGSKKDLKYNMKHIKHRM